MADETATELSSKDFAVGAALIVRLALADPDCVLSEQAEVTMRQLLATAPVDLYDDLNPDFEGLYQVISVVELVAALRDATV